MKQIYSIYICMFIQCQSTQFANFSSSMCTTATSVSNSSSGEPNIHSVSHLVTQSASQSISQSVNQSIIQSACHHSTSPMPNPTSESPHDICIFRCQSHSLFDCVDVSNLPHFCMPQCMSLVPVHMCNISYVYINLLFELLL